jgi:hypothetical protein
VIPASTRAYQVTYFTLSDTTASPGFKVTQFGLNNAYHPAGSDEPTYYDEFAALYGRNRVVACALSVEAHSLSQLMDICIYPVSLTGHQATTMAGAMEQRFAKSAIMDHDGNRDIVTVTCSVTLPQLVGSGWFDRDYSALSPTGTPTKALFWNIVTAPRVGANADVQMFCRLTQEIIWTEPLVSTSSP